MRFFDAHNHLQDERFADRAAVMAEARRAGLAGLVVNGACEQDWPLVQELADQFPEVLPSFGYHPWYLQERTSRWREVLAEFLEAMPSAVGEIGLDRWKPGLAYEGQEEAFLFQFQLATRLDRPASLHCLQAWGRLYDLLRESQRPGCGFLLHSYGGPKEMVLPLARLGAYFSFPGYFLHERKARQREAFSAVPLDRLLIETDAPDQMLPEALNRFPLADPAGTAINHPANLGVIHECVAQQRGLPVEDLAGALEANFRRLFGGVLRSAS